MEQWSLFKQAFRNWTVPADALVNEGYTDPEICLMHPMYCPSANVFDIDTWIGLRRYPEVQEGFFGQCPQPVRTCLANRDVMGRPIGA